MSILLRVERESGGQPIELGDGQITGYSYINTSPADFFAKAYNADHSIQIRGEIPLRLLPPVEQDADNFNTLYAWALTEYRPDNDYYRSVTVQIVRHEKTIREVKFTHAYVHVYQEQVNGLKGILEFELVVRQRRDQFDSIQFGSIEKKKKLVTILASAQEAYGSRVSYLMYAENSATEDNLSYKPSIDEIDISLKSALSKQQKIDLAKLQLKFKNAQATNDVKGMQDAHDAANAIRLSILDSVTRVNFNDSSSSVIYRTNSGNITIPATSSNGSVFKPYFKIEGSGAVFLAVGGEMKVQDGELALKLKGGFDGSVGGCLCIGSGADLVSGELGSSVKSNFGPTFAKGKYGAVLFYDGGAKFDPKTGAVEWTNGVAAGLGTEANILPFVIGIEGEYTILKIKQNLNEGKPATAAQWERFFKGESWESIFRK
ncbi:hypothetical protein [Paenibacillus oleatilyticus]|uniref:Uncharacterized protein n=1 Tax=Paenibacillus oleatilyticus TaxID=2594886 RepID=A0ABV4V7A1_9BACL